MTLTPEERARSIIVSMPTANFATTDVMLESLIPVMAEAIRAAVEAERSRIEEIERDETDILNAGAAGLAHALLTDNGHGEMSPGPCADALALVRELRAAVEAERQPLRKVYEKYKHLDDLLCDERWISDNMQTHILYELWQVIRARAQMGRAA